MIPSIAELISPELAGASGRIFGSDHEFVRFYIHNQSGDTYIGGGSVGPQWITTVAIEGERYDWILNVFDQLNQQLDLDFVESSTPNGSQINIYFDTEIEVGGSGTTLGLALSNEGRRRSWWEIVINAPVLNDDQDYLDFAIVHELGHVMGLEHPFDSSDGDVAGERFGDPDASETTMSYTRPDDGWPDFYSDADLTAMAAIWGLEDDRNQEWLIRNHDNEVLLLTADAANERLKEQNIGDLALLKDIDEAPDELMKIFKKIYAVGLPNKTFITNEDGITTNLVNFDSPQDSAINVRNFLKYVKDFYQMKSTEDAYDFFFRSFYASDVAIDYPTMQRVITTCSAAQALSKVKCCWCSWDKIEQHRFLDINDLGYPRKRDILWGNIIDVFRGCRCRTRTEFHCFCTWCDSEECQRVADDSDDNDS